MSQVNAVLVCAGGRRTLTETDLVGVYVGAGSVPLNSLRLGAASGYIQNISRQGPKPFDIIINLPPDALNASLLSLSLGPSEAGDERSEEPLLAGSHGLPSSQPFESAENEPPFGFPQASSSPAKASQGPKDTGLSPVKKFLKGDVSGYFGGRSLFGVSEPILKASSAVNEPLLDPQSGRVRSLTRPCPPKRVDRPALQIPKVTESEAHRIKREARQRQEAELRAKRVASLKLKEAALLHRRHAKLFKGFDHNQARYLLLQSGDFIVYTSQLLCYGDGVTGKIFCAMPWERLYTLELEACLTKSPIILKLHQQAHAAIHSTKSQAPKPNPAKRSYASVAGAQ